jgi:hypothetical protein
MHAALQSPRLSGVALLRYRVSLVRFQDNPKFKEALKTRSPKKRLAIVLDLCKSAKECNGGFEAAEEPAADGENKVGSLAVSLAL